ncbi:MAG: hypothetical protein MUF10_01065 [Thermoanaerobaculaceae bacterium]|jgi:hypothetical protein|nr:hypothetical protein [Thermoanaerobaculaceae bacterium]
MSLASRFLVDPGGFPASFGWTPWGRRRLGITLGDETYLLEGLAAHQVDLLASRFGAFCLGGDPRPGPVVRVSRVPEAAFLPPPAPPWVHTLDFDHRAESTAWVGVREAGFLHLGPRLEVSMWTAEGEGDMFGRAVENVLRLAVAYSLLHAGGLLFHAACVVDGDEAVVFPGLSGAGKSTTSRLSAAEGRMVLSDDIVGVTPGQAGFHVVALPFGSEFRFAGPSGTRVPLRTLCTLEKAEAIEVAGLKPSAAVGLALACTPYVNHDPIRADRLFENIERLVRAVRLRTLRFPRHGPIWSALQQGVL